MYAVCPWEHTRSRRYGHVEDVRPNVSFCSRSLPRLLETPRGTALLLCPVWALVRPASPWGIPESCRKELERVFMTYGWRLPAQVRCGRMLCLPRCLVPGVGVAGPAEWRPRALSSPLVTQRLRRLLPELRPAWPQGRHQASVSRSQPLFPINHIQGSSPRTWALISSPRLITIDN